MSNQDGNGSFERVALPAKGGSDGAPDSRSETFSPREWPTLEAARRDAEQAHDRAWLVRDWLAMSEALADRTALTRSIEILRRRRQFGGNGPLTDAGGEP